MIRPQGHLETLSSLLLRDGAHSTLFLRLTHTSTTQCEKQEGGRGPLHAHLIIVSKIVSYVS